MIKFSEENNSINSVFIETFFFHENEDLAPFFYSEVTGASNTILKEISKNQYSNRIGFYQFIIHENKYIKIYIYPKVAKLDISSTKAQLVNDFNIYFKEYMRLKRKYKSYKGFNEVTDNILDIDLHTASSIEEYLVTKYRKALIETINFFKKHNKEIFTTNEFYSQDITNTLNIKKNVIEINKSKIHQREDVVLSFSKIAEVALGVINSFSNLKVPIFDNSKLSNDVKILNSFLRKVLKSKFLHSQNLNSRSKIHKSLNSKIFQGHPKLSALKNNLLLLFGWNTDNTNIKINDVDSVWFSTDYMYELCVLENLENLQSLTNIDFHVKPNLQYNIMIDDVPLGIIKSYPDFTIETADTIYIIDAKWKIIYNINSINFIDILKANRDSIIHNRDSKSVKILIFYPLINLDKSVYEGKDIYYDYIDSPIFQIKELKFLTNNSLTQDLIT